ncbi:MAG: hypothetical protein K2F77_02045 [Muribaculaceae bacterium]|nr:hypothetical protein [Muribaculaceae bacterium]
MRSSVMIVMGQAMAHLPDFIRHYIRDYPHVSLSVEEMKAQAMLDALQRGSIDAGVGVCGNARSGLLEIPLYTEKFCVYLSAGCARDDVAFSPHTLEHENMWVMIMCVSTCLMPLWTH